MKNRQKKVFGFNSC